MTFYLQTIIYNYQYYKVTGERGTGNKSNLNPLLEEGNHLAFIL